MEIIKETSTEVLFRDYFEGIPVHFVKNKLTGEISINADDAIRAMGYNGTFEDYLGTDEGLDFISDWKRSNPDMPFWGGAVKRRTFHIQ